MQPTPQRSSGWRFYGCLTLIVAGLMGLCWFTSLGYLTTMRMLGL